MQDFWHDLWVRNETPWDLAGPHPKLGALLAMVQQKPGRALIPGCGRAHEAAPLIEAGYQVSAFDLSETAVAKAKEIHGAAIDFFVADIFSKDSEVFQKEPFDLIFDRAVWCALSPERQPKYIEKCHQLLVSRGLFASIPFTRLADPERKGPPFAIDLAAQSAQMRGRFELVDAYEYAVSSPESFLSSEAICLWQRV